ncbi:MmcQ-like protein [Chitinophaga caeni]|uniref:MmcQ-like protein n=1 Tax=Chitinophaga caeni TaxID=2029983 RepID=A0A291QX01_9BACT|nr:MmcQ/YjbR family DNA-binding protein [Chitinophaga caeni]ATL48393.1 MmcQ-like protein [Chitinophaga caeni]
MDIEQFREFCLTLKGTSEGFPFGEETLVFYVAGKMFALTDVTSFESVNLKCDPGEAIELRERYPAIIPGYHMNKKHWNTIINDGSISNSMMKKLIQDSYDLVFAKLPKKTRESIGDK